MLKYINYLLHWWNEYRQRGGGAKRLELPVPMSTTNVSRPALLFNILICFVILKICFGVHSAGVWTTKIKSDWKSINKWMFRYIFSRITRNPDIPSLTMRFEEEQKKWKSKGQFIFHPYGKFLPVTYCFPRCSKHPVPLRYINKQPWDMIQCIISNLGRSHISIRGFIYYISSLPVCLSVFFVYKRQKG